MLVGHKECAALQQAIEDKGRASLQEASHSHCQAAKLFLEGIDQWFGSDKETLLVTNL